MSNSQAKLQVFLLGFGRSPIASKLIAELRAKGVRARRVATACELTANADPRERVALLIDCRKGDSEALEALNCVRHRTIPVAASVLVKESDFGQYYRLVGAGAKGFFSHAEEPAFIARGIRLMAQA